MKINNTTTNITDKMIADAVIETHKVHSELGLRPMASDIVIKIDNASQNFHWEGWGNSREITLHVGETLGPVVQRKEVLGGKRMYPLWNVEAWVRAMIAHEGTHGILTQEGHPLVRGVEAEVVLRYLKARGRNLHYTLIKTAIRQLCNAEF